MEPRIQYAQTSDGVSIAYWVMGEGEPLVVLPDIPISHLQLEWQSRRAREWYEHLAKVRRVVRYDGRGMGLSDREVADFSVGSYVRDLEAVVEATGLERFALFGDFHGGCVATAYSGRNPERVSQLVLWCSYLKATDTKWKPALGGLLNRDWDVYSETVAGTLVGWGEPAKRYANYVRAAVEPEQLHAAWQTIRRFDVSSLAEEITAPTLVMHRRGLPFGGEEVARRLASRIKGARMVVADGESAVLWRESQAAANAMLEFLGAEPLAATPENESTELSSTESGTAIILFADIVDSTALTEELGDAAFRDKARELDEELRTITRRADGTPVEGKLLGDGVLSVFTSAKNAIEAALSFGEAAESVALRLHLGIHAGDVIREEGNVFGGAVNIAARISSESEAGEVLVSQTVRDLARTSANVSFEDRGEQELKGVGEPVRLYAVGKGD